MGLDAVVYCRCYEEGRLRAPPPTECRVEDDGSLESASGNFDDQLRFDQWRMNACEHEDGLAIHRFLGNVAMVALIHQKLQSAPRRFPLLLSRVVHSGTHAGDHIDASLVAALAVEVDAIGTLASVDPEEQRELDAFQRHMRDLIEVARHLGKPIAF